MKGHQVIRSRDLLNKVFPPRDGNVSMTFDGNAKRDPLSLHYTQKTNFSDIASHRKIGIRYEIGCRFICLHFKPKEISVNMKNFENSNYSKSLFCQTTMLRLDIQENYSN